jgi:Ca-activated chloride channel family protein
MLDLQCLKGEAVSLQSVHAQGQLQGPLLRMKLRQTYRNTTPTPLECVCNFALAWGTVWMGMAVELHGERMRVTAPPEKHTACVHAIEIGNQPLMLERSGQDRLTAHVGILQPGEQVVIELEYAQLLRLDGGQLRLRLPTHMATPCGEADIQSGLAPELTQTHSPQAEYRLNVSLDVNAPLSQGTISSPSHEVKLVKRHDGVTVKLQSKAWLDREFVLTVHGLNDMAFALASADTTQADQYTLLASAVAQWPATQSDPAPLRMKILVDCSASMQGDSIAQAREALEWLFHQLHANDEVSMTRFGSTTAHVLPRLQRCTVAYQRRLQAEARNILANLGGADLESALRQVIAITHEDEEPVGSASILLITDGAVWDIENLVASVRQHGHRVFALGVGSSPAESLLRELAEASGGACEMFSPKQNIQQAVARLLDRMHRSSPVTCSLLSDAPVVYQSPSIKEVTQGDTLYQWAQVRRRPDAAPTLQWTLAGHTFKSQAAQLIWDTDGILPRLCAAQRLLDTRDEALQTALALHYQLLTKRTHFVLVHERAAGDKAQCMHQLQQTAPTQAAGASDHGAFIQDASSVLQSTALDERKHQKSALASMSAAVPSTPAAWRSDITQASARADSLAHGRMGNIEDPAFLRQSIDDGTEPTDMATPSEAPTPNSSSANAAATPIWSPELGHKRPHKIHGDPLSPLSKFLQNLNEPSNPLAGVLNRFNAQADGNRCFRSALSVSLSTARIAFMADFILQHAKALGSPAMVWAVVLLWLADAKGLPLERQARRLLEKELKGVDAGLRLGLIQNLEAAATQNVKTA